MKNIKKIELEDKEIYLLPSAHISKVSVEETESAIRNINPDTICVELDQDRFNKLKKPDDFLNTDINTIIKDKKVGFLLLNIIISNFQKNMADHLKNENGGEMIKAIELSEELNKNLELVDRKIDITFNRIYAKLNLIEKIKLLYIVVSSIFDDKKISEDDILKLQNQDILDNLISDFSKHFPIVKEVLIDERDRYIAHKIKNSSGKKVFAVLGAGHLNGVIENLKINYSIENINQKIEKKTNILAYIIPIIIIFGILAITFKNFDIGIKQLLTWFLLNSTLSAIGVMLAKGHLYTILTALITAPFSAIHPLFAVGFFTGICEAKILNPKIIDFKNISNDTKNISGYFKNKITRILMVVVFSNIMAGIGTFVSTIDIIKNFLSLF